MTSTWRLDSTDSYANLGCCKVASTWKKMNGVGENEASVLLCLGPGVDPGPSGARIGGLLE